jgi:tetratricopeptide (TPR) repeat protein
VIREGRYKYIQAPRPELFDLATDPGETKNLAATEPSRAEAMRAALGRSLDAERAQAAAGTAGATVPAELLEKLGALGYVGAGGAAQTKTPGADPKDKVEEFRFANDQIREGLLRFHAKDYVASVGHFQAVLKRGISSFEVHFYLARGLLALGRVADAARHFEEATSRAPAHAEAWEGLKDARLLARDPKGAIDALHRGEKALPAEASLRIAEGKVLRDLGRGSEARQVLESALPLAPRNAALRMYLGELLREQGALDEAVKRQREAVDLEPKDASSWNSLGMTLGGSQKFAEAEKCFREAVRLNGDDHRYAFNLGLSLVRQGRAKDARPFFEKSLARNPAFAPARDELRALDRGGS